MSEQDNSMEYAAERWVNRRIDHYREATKWNGFEMDINLLASLMYDCFEAGWIKCEALEKDKQAQAYLDAKAGW